MTSSSVLSSENDEELMEKVKKQNKMAITVLYERYKTSVFNLVFQYLKSGQRSEEITHDIFITVFTKAEQYQSGKAFRPWLWSMVRNRALDELRKKKEVLIGDWSTPEDKEHPMDKIESNDYTPEMELIEKAQQEVVQKCLDNLPANMSEALKLRLMAELSYQEISKMVSKSESAIKTILFRAREFMKECISSELGESL